MKIDQNLIEGAILSSLLLAVGHWFPWLNGLPRLYAYVYGCAVIWLGFAFWRLNMGDWQTPLGLAIIIGVAGLTTWAAYEIDHAVQKMRQADKAEAADDELP